MSCYIPKPKLVKRSKDCALISTHKEDLNEKKCLPCCEDMTVDTPSQNSYLTESSSDSETGFIRLENEIIADQLSEKLYNYRLSCDSHLKGRKTISSSIKNCKNQFILIQNSAQGILSNTKHTKRELKNLEKQFFSFENQDECPIITENTEKILSSQLKSIQDQIFKLNNRVSTYEEKTNEVKEDDDLIKAKLDSIQNIIFEQKVKSINCTSCSIF